MLDVRPVEHRLQFPGRRGDVLDIDEQPAGGEQPEDLLVERPLAGGGQVVDGVARDDQVEGAVADLRRERVGEVAVPDLAAVPERTHGLVSPPEHRLGGVDEARSGPGGWGWGDEKLPSSSSRICYA